MRTSAHDPDIAHWSGLGAASLQPLMRDAQQTSAVAATPAGNRKVCTITMRTVQKHMDPPLADDSPQRLPPEPALGNSKLPDLVGCRTTTTRL